MPLNLPEYPLNIKKGATGQLIFDRLRKRFVALTPEEWVRQNFVEYLIHEKGYPAALMANEVSISQNGIKRRCDTLVANRHGLPLVVIEYKAPHIGISQHTFDQIVRYNMVLRARWLIVSNGMNHYCCSIDHQKGTYEFKAEIPSYGSLLE